MSLWKGQDHDGSAKDGQHAAFPLDKPQTIQGHKPLTQIPRRLTRTEEWTGEAIWLPWTTTDGRDRPLKPHGWDPDTGEVFEIGQTRKIHAGHYREALTRLAKAHNLKRSQIRLIAKTLEAPGNLRKSFTDAVLQYTDIQLDEIQATIALI